MTPAEVAAMKERVKHAHNGDLLGPEYRYAEDVAALLSELERAKGRYDEMAEGHATLRAWQIWAEAELARAAVAPSPEETTG